MKKNITLTLAAALMLFAAPAFAQMALENPCGPTPAKSMDVTTVERHEACMAEYEKAKTLTGAEQEKALAKAKAVLEAREDQDR